MQDEVDEAKNYTTTRENWELRLIYVHCYKTTNYTTTRENWELRLLGSSYADVTNYTTTRENWELRPGVLSGGHCPVLYHYERKLGTTTPQ